MLELKNISKEFVNNRSRVKKVLDDVSISVSRGDSIGLVGPSGCGKTTLTRIAMKLIPPTSGRVIIDGEDVTDIPNRKYKSHRAKMQMVFQNPFTSMDPTKTMRWSLDQAYSAFGKEKGDYLELCKRFGVPEDVLDRRPMMISGGEIQRISIIRALASDPDYLLLDEPTSMLDVSIQASVMRMITDWNEENHRGMLLITHDMDLVRHVCEKVYAIEEGKIVDYGDADEVLDRMKI